MSEQVHTTEQLDLQELKEEIIRKVMMLPDKDVTEMLEFVKGTNIIKEDCTKQCSPLLYSEQTFPRFAWFLSPSSSTVNVQVVITHGSPSFVSGPSGSSIGSRFAKVPRSLLY